MRCAFVGSGRPQEQLRLGDTQDFGQVRFMESYESKHSDHDFTARLAAKLGVTQSPLRLDSQAKYGALYGKSDFIKWHLSTDRDWRIRIACMQVLFDSSSYMSRHMWPSMATEALLRGLKLSLLALPDFQTHYRRRNC